MSMRLELGHEPETSNQHDAGKIQNEEPCPSPDHVDFGEFSFFCHDRFPSRLPSDS